ncbi:MAG: thiol oxidoreductase [Ignavibacteria bacterium]|nr:thiol oxidoreductase [Ignavibacteria bacterium]
MTKYYLCLLIFASAQIFICGCSPIVPDLPASSDILDGPIPGLSSQDHRRHLAGDAAFNDVVFTPSTGLGPVFVASSCGSCHAGDGRGHPSTALIRFGQTDPGGNPWIGRGGPQLQQRAIVGYMPEQLPSDAVHSTLLAPAVTGLGFIEAIAESTIVALEDRADANGDGVSGVTSRVNAPGYAIGDLPLQARLSPQLGRFGRKAGAVSLIHQTANAYNQDIGIASVFEPIDVYVQREIDPEILATTVRDVVFYLRTLRVPERRNASDPVVKQGEQLFNTIGCASCHIAEIQTGESVLPYLSNKTIHPYSDLLLHDMGQELDDGYTEGSALSSEWRTTPLWGLGLSARSQGGNMFLLHDGRARSIQAAIDFHGGEGATSRAGYRALSDSEKQALLKFLESL